MCGPEVSGEFKVNVGLRWGTPLLSIAVVEPISRNNSTNDLFRTLLYADALAVVADVEANLQDQLIEWKYMFRRHGLSVCNDGPMLIRGQFSVDPRNILKITRVCR